MMVAVNAYRELVSIEWRLYAQPRFVLGEQRERRAWKEFQERTEFIFTAYEKAAVRLKAGPLGYTVDQLRHVILRTLERRCTFCTTPLSLDSFAVTERTPCEHGGGHPFRMANLLVCCTRCAVAKGSHTEAEWARIASAINAADKWAAQRTMDRLVQGGTREDLGPSPTRPAAGNARAAKSRHVRPEKLGLSTAADACTKRPRLVKRAKGGAK